MPDLRPRPPEPAPRPAANLPASILIVRLGAIGDVVNALVLATAIKDHEPSTHIGWAVHPLAEPLVRDHPSVDRVHLCTRGLRGLLRCRAELAREGYSVAIDLQRIAKSAWLARGSRAERVLGFDRRRAKEGSWLLTREHLPPADPSTHMVQQALEFARFLGIPDPRPRRLLPEDPQARAWAQERVRALGAPPVLINLGASKAPNRWPPERFGELARGLVEECGVPVLLTGGGEDRPAAERALRVAGGAIESLVGGTGLRELYHLMDHARLFVGCDTGPAHLAAARGLRVVALFGPADPRRTGPFGEGHRILREPAWNPAQPHSPARMMDLEVDTVLGAAAGILRESTPAAPWELP